MTELQASPLILTKYHLPGAPARLVPRLHLVEQLTLGAGTDLVLVCAPAGYGKTTLLVEWARFLLQNGVAVAWYAIDPSDDAPLTFAAYLTASLQQAIGPLPELERLSQFLRAAPEVELSQALPALINAIAACGRDCVLIIDDYHLIGTPSIHAALAFLLEHLPENLHLALGSRADPPLPLARLRAHRQLIEVRASQLRFSTQETALFFSNIMQLDLSARLIEHLAGRTEGWIAGLQLAGLSLAGQADQDGFTPESVFSSFTGRHRYLVEYLLEEVFNRQPAAVQEFLLATSILERMNAPLCGAVSGQPHPAAILEQLAKANLFVVALDEQGEWFRYHHLFRDFLRTTLQKNSPHATAALHHQASQWYAGNGFLREAVQHAFLTHDWDYAADIVEQHGFTLLIHSELATLYEWCSAFPEDVMQRRPLLCILQSWNLVFRFSRQYQGRVEARLQQASQAIAALPDGPSRRELGAHAAVVRTYLCMVPDPQVDPQAHLALAREMLEQNPEPDAGRFNALLMSSYSHMALHDLSTAQQDLEAARQIALPGRLFSGIVESTFHLARLLYVQGQLPSAIALCQQTQAELRSLLAHPASELPIAGGLDIALGCILLEQDALQEAERRLLHGLDQLRPWMSPHYLTTACLALFRLRQAQGRADEGLAFLARLEEAWPDIAFCTHALRLLHTLRLTPGDPHARAEAAAWQHPFGAAAKTAHPPGLGPFGAAEVYYQADLGWAEAQVISGSPQIAQPYLEQQLALSKAHGLASRVIELSLLQALAHQSAGHPDLARRALEQALAAGQPAGFVRIFDQGPILHRLLHAAQKNLPAGQHHAYLQRILAAIDRSVTSKAGNGPLQPGATPSGLEFGQHLSERELEVLRLMARGAANQDIADQLVITVGTVKSHINHILVKLEAHNRTEAVALARAAGLLDP